MADHQGPSGNPASPQPPPTPGQNVSTPASTPSTTTPAQAVGMRLPHEPHPFTTAPVTQTPSAVTFSTPQAHSSVLQPGVSLSTFDAETSRIALIVKAVLEQTQSRAGTPAVTPAPAQPSTSAIGRITTEDLGTVPLAGAPSPQAFSSFQASPIIPNAQVTPSQSQHTQHSQHSQSHPSQTPTRNYLLTQASVNSRLNDTRRNILSRERQDLDTRIGKYLQVPFCTVVSQLREDFSTTVTVSATQDLFTFVMRVLEPGSYSRPPLTELKSVSEKLADFKRQLFRDGPQGPTNPAWRIAADFVTRFCDKVELETLRHHSDAQNASTVSLSSDISMMSAQSMQTLASLKKVKHMREWDGVQDVDDYLSHFEIMSRGMTAIERRDWLQNKMGAGPIRRLNGIEEKHTWAEVKAFVSSQLSDCVDAVAVSAKLDQLKQSTSSVLPYNDELYSLLAKMNRSPHDIMDVSMITKYIRGLSDFKMRKKFISRHRQNQQRGNSRDTLWTFMSMARDEEENTKAANEGLDEVPDRSRHHGAFVAASAPASTSGGARGGTSPFRAMDKPCVRHDAPNKHTAAKCKTAPGVCPYCRLSVSDAQFRDGSHKKVCTVKPCTHCHRRGHEAEVCTKRAFDEGGAEAVKALAEARAAKRQERKRKRTDGAAGGPPPKKVYMSEEVRVDDDDSDTEDIQNECNDI